MQFPCVIRGEGVGHAPGGRRVYFGERSVAPFEDWAERTLVPTEEVWDVPDDVDDALAITMGIAGTGALLPLEQARIQPGETVLMLGGTGTLGQLALQLARILGGGPGRHRRCRGPEGCDGRGVRRGSRRRMRCAHACGAEGHALGRAGGWLEVKLDIADLLFRSLSCVGTGQRSASDREATWRRLLRMAHEHRITFDYVGYRFDQMPDAWASQVAGPHAKITASLKA